MSVRCPPRAPSSASWSATASPRRGSASPRCCPARNGLARRPAPPMNSTRLTWSGRSTQGCRHRYYIRVGKDAFDGAVCLRLAPSRKMDEVLGFLGECWKDLGRPEQVQFDSARELAGWGPAARTLSRVIRLCLRFGVGPVFIPEGEPQFNSGVENFNSWFQEPLFQRRFKRPGGLCRELARLQEA